MSAANQVSVSQAALLLSDSFHVTCARASTLAHQARAERLTQAWAVSGRGRAGLTCHKWPCTAFGPKPATAFTPSCAPKIHSPTVRPSAPAVIFSLRDSGPSLASSSLQA